MEQRSTDSGSQVQPVPVYLAPTFDADDEVRLSDIWEVAGHRKGLILITVLAFLLMAGAYLLFVKPVYKATAYLLPPQLQDIQGLIIDYSGLEHFAMKQYTPESVYHAFLANLKSQGLRREFFDTRGLAGHYAQGKSEKSVNADLLFDTGFNSNLRVTVDKDMPSFVTISFNDKDPDLAAQWLNELISLVSRRTVTQLISNIMGNVEMEINWIQFQLASKLKLAEQRRRDTIISLNEALSVARELDITSTTLFPKIADRGLSGLAVNTAEMPLYMRGTRALEKEIEVLETRKSDEPFIRGYRDLQERRAFLEEIVIDPDSLSVVTLDREATVPYRVEKPRPVLVMSIFLGAGTVVAFLLAFFIEVRRKEQAGVG